MFFGLDFGVSSVERGQAYRSKHKLSKAQYKAMRAVEQCRTAALGGHMDACDQCGHVRISYNPARMCGTATGTAPNAKA